MNPVIFSRSYAVSKIESGCFPKGAYVISFFDSSNKREVHIDFSSATKNCLYFDYNQIVCLDTAEIRTNSSLQQELSKLSQFIFAAFKEDKTIICQCETGKTISAACAAAIQQEFNQHGIEVFANIDYSPDKRVYKVIREALLEYEIKRAMHQDRRRLHGIQESIQEYVTVCNHPHAFIDEEIADAIYMLRSQIELNARRTYTYLTGKMIDRGIIDLPLPNHEGKEFVTETISAFKNIWEEYCDVIINNEQDIEESDIRDYVYIENKLKAFMRSLKDTDSFRMHS